jgi:hypothetical protein
MLKRNEEGGANSVRSKIVAKAETKKKGRSNNRTAAIFGNQSDGLCDLISDVLIVLCILVRHLCRC